MIQYRLKHEYGASVAYEQVNLYKACWVSSEDDPAMSEFENKRKRDLALDTKGNLVYLAESSWALKLAQENHPEVVFHFTSEI